MMIDESRQNSSSQGQQQHHQQHQQRRRQQNISPVCLQSASSSQQIDPRQTDFVAAQLWRMQQAREEEENNTLIQLINRQQTAASTAGSSAPFNGMNLPSSRSPSGSNAFFGSQDMNKFMLPHSIATNFGMNMGGMDIMNNMNSDMIMNQPMPISNMNNAPASAALSMPSSMIQANGNAPVGNSPSQFKTIDLSCNDHFWDSSLPTSKNIIPTPSGSNRDMNMNCMDTINNNFFQNNKLMASSGNTNFHSNNLMNIHPHSANPHSANSIQQALPKQEDPGWEEQYNALRAYHLQFGHCKVPARHKANSKLGRWVMTQRRQFTLLAQGLPSALTTERILRLESLGFTWYVRPEAATTWNQRFRELTAHKATYGNCMVPQRYRANLPLGTWVHTQRRQNKLMSEGKKSSMTEEKAKALDSIGFNWDAKQPLPSSELAKD